VKKIDLGKSSGHYSSAVISGNYVFVSGQLSTDPVTGAVPSTIFEETITALKKVEEIVCACGVNKESIVQCRVYMTANEQWEEMNKAYAQFFGTHKPARVAFPALGLSKGCHIEIEAIAELSAT